MRNTFKNIIAGIIDIIIFVILVWYGVPWMLAFFISTLIVIGGWWALSYLNTWFSYR